jgi:tetratricopeptide (TPR) repeat protein
MTTRSRRSLYRLDGAESVDAERENQPGRTLRLFVSLPAYAETERQRISDAVAAINATFDRTLKIDPVWAGASTQDGASGAADCDAVIAILRPRFPTDAPASAEQGAAGSHGGAAGLVSAMGGGKGGVGLPDIYIFRYAESAEHAANDADWQAGKGAFGAWFKARGGKVLAFEDFDSSDAFGERLDERLRSWRDDLGYDLPVEMPTEPAAEGVAEQPPAPEPETPLSETPLDDIAALAAEIAELPAVADPPEELADEPVAEAMSELVVQEADEASEAVPAEPEIALETDAESELLEDTADSPAEPAVLDVSELVAGESAGPEASEAVPAEPETADAEPVEPQAEPAVIVDALDSALEIEEDPSGDAGVAEEAAAVPAEPDAELATHLGAAPVVDNSEAATSEIALDSALKIEFAAPLGEAEEQVSDGQQTSDTMLSATVIPLRPERPQVEIVPSPTPKRNRTALVLLAGAAAASLLLAAVLGVQWRSAASRDKQTQQSLAAASGAANNLVFELTDESRRLGGATSDGSKAILDEARKLQGSLVIAGPFNPDALMAQGDAAMTSSEALFKQGKPAEALKDAIQGQHIFQTLYSTDPDKPGWAKRLAESNLKIGDVLVSQNNLIEALGAYRDSLTLQKAIVLKDPHSVEKQLALSLAQQKVGDVLVVKGRLDEGLAVYRDAAAIRKSLAQSDAGNAERQRDLLEIDNKVADVLSAQSHLDASLVIYREALAIASRMALMNPAEPHWRAAMTLTNNKIGDVLVGKERIDDGLAAYREGLASIKDVAANDPRNNEWQSLIATTYERIGDAFVAESHFESALSSYRDALAVVQALVAKEPTNVAWRRGLSETHLRIGSVYFNQNNLDGALGAHRDSLAIVKALAADDPNNSRWQHDVMIDSNDIGLLLTSKGSRGDALPYYREAQTIATAMAAKEPNDSSWQSTHGMIDNNIGAVLLDQGNRDDAIAAYRDALSVAKALVARDPRNAEWQTSLVVALYNLGEAGEDPRGNFAQAKDLLERLDQAGVLRPDKRALIAKVDDALTKFSSGKPLLTGRRESSRRAAAR